MINEKKTARRGGRAVLTKPHGGIRVLENGIPPEWDWDKRSYRACAVDLEPFLWARIRNPTNSLCLERMAQSTHRCGNRCYSINVPAGYGRLDHVIWFRSPESYWFLLSCEYDEPMIHSFVPHTGTFVLPESPYGNGTSAVIYRGHP